MSSCWAEGHVEPGWRQCCNVRSNKCSSIFSERVDAHTHMRMHRLPVLVTTTQLDAPALSPNDTVRSNHHPGPVSSTSRCQGGKTKNVVAHYFFLTCKPSASPSLSVRLLVAELFSRCGRVRVCVCRAPVVTYCACGPCSERRRCKQQHRTMTAKTKTNSDRDGSPRDVAEESDVMHQILACNGSACAPLFASF